MSDNTIAPYESRFQKELNQISPNAYERIDEIESYSTSTGLRILTLLVEYACKSQNTALIVLARNQIKKIPLDWLHQHFVEVASTCICFEDEWEYRRLLELVSEALPKLLNWAIEKGIDSANEEIREAAEDFMEQ